MVPYDADDDDDWEEAVASTSVKTSDAPGRMFRRFKPSGKLPAEPVPLMLLFRSEFLEGGGDDDDDDDDDDAILSGMEPRHSPPAPSV